MHRSNETHNPTIAENDMSEEQSENLVDVDEYLPQNLSLELSISVVQELVDQFTILKTINNWPNVENDFQYKTLQERFEKTVFHNENIQKNLCPENFYYIATLSNNLLEELKKNGDYSQFTETIKVLKQMKVDEETLLNEAANKEEIVNQLQGSIDFEKNDNVIKIVNCMTRIGKIKDEIENFQIESDIKLNYIKSLQKAKQEMNETLYSSNIEEKNEEIKTTKAKIVQDIRVHNDIEAAMNEFIKELEDKVDEWKRRYNEKLDEMNKKLHVLQTKQNKQLEIISNYKDLYTKRQKEIDEYKQHKIEQELLRLEKEKRNKAATKIQAWWRGTMVRKGFGKFRKKKEKKGKKKSTEKKEKK